MRFCSQQCEDAARIVGRNNKNGTQLSLLLDEKQVKTISCLIKIGSFAQYPNLSKFQIIAGSFHQEHPSYCSKP